MCLASEGRRGRGAGGWLLRGLCREGVSEWKGEGEEEVVNVPVEGTSEDEVVVYV